MEPSNSTPSSSEQPRKKKITRRQFTPEQKAALVTEIQALVAGGMRTQDACAKVKVGETQYHAWKVHDDVKRLLGKNGKHLPMIRRPPAHLREVIDVPAPFLERVNGHKDELSDAQTSKLLDLMILLAKRLA